MLPSPSRTQAAEEQGDEVAVGLGVALVRGFTDDGWPRMPSTAPAAGGGEGLGSGPGAGANEGAATIPARIAEDGKEDEGRRLRRAGSLGYGLRAGDGPGQAVVGREDVAGQREHR